MKAFGVSQAAVTAEKKKIYTWFAEQFKYFLDGLAGVTEPNGKLLDNTAVVYFSEMGYGQDHSKNNIPIIIAGGAQKAFKMGQYVDLNATYKGMYNGRPDAGRSMNDLWQSVLQGYGIRSDSFGEKAFSKGVIPEILT